MRGTSPYLVNDGARVALTRCITQHGDAGLDAECNSSICTAESNLTQLVAGWIHVDGAVAKQVHPVGKQHEKDG